MLALILKCWQGNLQCALNKAKPYTVVWEKFTVGIFHVKKFHIKIFSSSWVKYSNLLPYLFNGKNISCVKFSS